MDTGGIDWSVSHPRPALNRTRALLAHETCLAVLFLLLLLLRSASSPASQPASQPDRTLDLALPACRWVGPSDETSRTASSDISEHVNWVWGI